MRELQIIFRRWLEFIQVAWDSVLANRLRSLLTVIGVVIGVAVVAIVASLLEGASNFIVAQTANFAPDVIRIEKASFQDFAGDGQAFVTAQSKRRMIVPDDLEFLRARFGERLEIGGQKDASLPVRRADKTLAGIVIQGVTPNITQLTTLKVESGREFAEIDDVFRQNVCIIGADVANEFFPNDTPLGQEIRVGQLPFIVVGVAETRGSLFGASQDGFVLIPLGTYNRIFGERSRSMAILARAKPESGISRDEAEEIMRVGMRLRRKLEFGTDDDFSVVTAKSVQAFTSTLTGIIAVITYPLTLIALVVGGIVVMNMMLASVTERTKEIGIRMAIGATRRDIMTQFLFEATLLTLIGGLLGLGLAFLLVQTLAWATKLPVYLPIWAVLTAIGLSVAVGIIFGVLPARRASKLDPIEALRSE